MEDRAIHEAWETAMRAGDFDRAWRLSDLVLASPAAARWRSPELPAHRRIVWDGRPLRGHVLVRCHHGFGDTIQFARYLPLLRKRVDGVTLSAQAELLPLLASLPGLDEFQAKDDGLRDHRYDAAIEVMELAQAFRTHIASIPAESPFLSPPPDLVALWATRLGIYDRLRIGLVWTAGAWRPYRFVPLALLGEIPDVALYPLQSRSLPAPYENRGPRLTPLPTELAAIVDAAAAILNMNLIITVDTMVAHLAGALGAPVWTLLAHNADWRRLEGRIDTPWYPTVRLFRQEVSGCWRAPLEAVAAELEGTVTNRMPVGRYATGRQA